MSKELNIYSFGDECYVYYGDYAKEIEKYPYGAFYGIKPKQAQDVLDLCKEIERLNENNQAMQVEMARTWEKLDEKENIIKEAIEYIEENGITEITWWVRRKPTRKELFKDGASLYELLEILQGSDKE